MVMANEGIMNLPQGQEMQQQAGVPDTRALDSMAPNSGAYRNINKNLQDLDPRMVEQYKAAIAPVLARLDMSADQIDKMIQFFDYLSANKDQYKQLIQQLIDQGAMQPGDLPEEYDGTLIAVIQLVLHQKRGDSSFQDQQGIGSLPQGQGQSERPPFAMKTGGLVDAAKHIQSMGRNGDKILAHINPQEAEILKRMGGSGTINPATGLMEFGFWSDVWGGIKDVAKSVVNVVKEVISSPVGKILATVALSMFLGPAGAAYGGGFFTSAAVAAGVAGAGISAIGGGSLKDIVKSGLMAYAGSTLMSSIGGTSTPSPNADAVVPTGTEGAGADAVTSPYVPPDPSAVGTSLPPVDAVGGTAPPGPIQGIEAVNNAANLPSFQQEIINNSQAPSAVDTGGGGSPNNVGGGLNEGSSGASVVAQAAPPAAPPPAPNANPSLTDRFMDNPIDTTADVMTRGAQTAQQVADARQLAGLKAYNSFPPGTADKVRALAYEKAFEAAGPGLVTQYGPTAALIAGGTYLAGGFKPTPVDQNPLGKPQTSADYIAAHPEFAGYKGWEPGVPSVNSPVPTSQPNMSPLAPNSPYTIPMGTSTGRAPGSSITQPYNVAGLYNRNGIGGLYNPNMPTPMNTGGEINNPEHSGTGMQPTLTSSFAEGGIGTLARGGYPRKVGKIDGPGTATSDSIPAMLSDGEFVFTAKAVRNAGKGNRREGAKKMYQLMHMLEHGGSVKGA